MKNPTILLLLTLLGSSNVLAQVSQGGQPIGWQQPSSYLEFERLPDLNMQEIEAEDAIKDQYKEFGYRFGIERTVSLSPENSGYWSVENKKKVWRVGVHAPNAKAVSFLFSRYNLPKGATVFIYDKDQTHFIGGFDYRNKQVNGMLATSLVYGEDIIVEVSLPDIADRGSLDIEIGQVVHAYRGISSKIEEVRFSSRGPFGNSGSCNINVNCPLGDDWQVEKRAVALIASGGNAICSGALVNNTNNDGHPYFLTANHCLGGVGNWVFYFNHETSGCSGNTGPTNQTVSGASVVSSNSGSDFGLLEINNGNAIPSSYNAEWAGWDNSDNENAVSAATGIHHPSGDLKKICHDDDGPYHANQSGAAVWYIDEWEDGTTEGGSSGSPLFNQDHRIIGQLYGGSASCFNQSGADWYGRFGVSWNGSSSSTRLRDWLDPGNTGVTTLDGYPTGSVVYSYDAASNGFSNLPNDLCEISNVTPSFTLKNNGTTNLMSCTITYSYNGGGNQVINWTGNLAQSGTESVQLASFTPILGTNTITATVSSPNQQTDQNGNNNSITETFNVNIGESFIKLSIRTDDYGYETYWELRGPANQLVASGGNTNVGPNGGGNSNATANDPGAYSNNTTINETIQLVGDGCYTFLIVDDYGDGMCCDFGQGNYRLRDGNNTILFEGGEYEDNEETEFGMTGGETSSVSETQPLDFKVYPNPSKGTIQLEIGNIEIAESFNVTDISGRLLIQNQVVQNRTAVVLENLVNGIYSINLITTEGTVSKKVVLMNE